MMLRAGDAGGVLTMLRQADYLLYHIAFDDRALAADPERLIAAKRLPLLADRLMHVAARLEVLGYELPELRRVSDVLRRRGLPATLAEWREQAKANTLWTSEEVDDSEG